MIIHIYTRRQSRWQSELQVSRFSTATRLIKNFYCQDKMSRNIFIHNKSTHNQEFEIHGWNKNKNMVVAARSTATIAARDGSSGAIIALHDGHEGEQAEITKHGFGGESPPLTKHLLCCARWSRSQLWEHVADLSYVGRKQAMTSST